MKKYNESMKQQEELRNKIQECELKLERAQKLTEGLSEEKTRWAIDIKTLVRKMELIPGDSVISAGMVATQDHSQAFIAKNWRRYGRSSLRL
jgi:dynein heavy chain